jgi:hypothetical protein
MDQRSFVERRKHRRYIVDGTVRFTVGPVSVSGALINFGHGGMLVRADGMLGEMVSEAAQLDFQVTAYCYPETFRVLGEIVGGKNSLLAVKFLERPHGAKELLLWLEGENFPWTSSSSTLETLTLPPQSSGFRPSVEEVNARATLDCIFQDA